MGSGTCRGGTNAQCGSYAAPDSTQRERICFCASESGLLMEEGGICSASCALIRFNSSLCVSLPGSTA